MTTVIRNASAADLIAAVPTLLDRDPLGSLVLIAFRGKRTFAAVRLDLPRPDLSRAGEKRYTATALGLFSKIQGAEDVVPVAFPDAPVAAAAGLLRALTRRFEQAGYAVRDVLAAGSDGWSSYRDPDARLGALAEIESAAARLGLEPPAGLPGRIAPDEPELQRTRNELARIRMLVDEGDDLSVLDRLDDLPFFVEGALAWSEAELAEHGALLLFALQGPPARDLVMLQWAFGLDLGDAMWSADTCAGLEARKKYLDIDVRASELILGRGESPSIERIEAAAALLTTLISRADDADRPAPLCMLAWLNWAIGRGSIAGAHIDEVRSIAPEYSMGQLLDTLFSSGMLPEWMFVRGGGAAGD